MLDLSNFLRRFTDSLNKDDLNRSKVAEVVKEVVGVDLSLQNIQINKSVLEIKTSPTIKSEINLKAGEVLTLLRDKHRLSFQRILYR